MKLKKFQKKKEDFICQNCGHKNIGNGYTNHCSICLYSKHVDINPGDRKETCGGLMKPILVFQKGKNIYLTHQCLVCGKQKNNQLSPNDSFENVLNIIKKNQN